MTGPLLQLLPAALGGTDFENRTWGRSYSGTTTHRANTWVDVSGSGLLVAVHENSNLNGVAVQVDGGPILGFAGNVYWEPLLILPFKTGLKVTGDVAVGSTSGLWYLLD
jgi:hypothetical protein